MREFVEKENIMAQPRRMLISSFNLTIGTILNPLLLFYLKLGLVSIKIQRFVQYTPRRCFNNFVQSAVNARRQGDENPNSSVVAETMKLLANSSYGYQIMDRSRQTVTKYLNFEEPSALGNHSESSITSPESSANQNRALRHPSRIIRHPRALG